MCCRFWAASRRGRNSLGRSENNEPRQREYGCSVTLVRWPDGQNSPRLYALLRFLLRRWRANAGKNCPAILAVSRRKGRLDAMGFTIPPAWPCHAVPPLHKGGHLCLSKYNRHDYSAALGTGRDPAWGAKKVGEKPSFSPRASGGVGYRFASYFGFMPK